MISASTPHSMLALRTPLLPHCHFWASELVPYQLTGLFSCVLSHPSTRPGPHATTATLATNMLHATTAPQLLRPGTMPPLSQGGVFIHTERCLYKISYALTLTIINMRKRICCGVLFFEFSFARHLRRKYFSGFFFCFLLVDVMTLCLRRR